MLTSLVRSPWQKYAAPLNAMTVADALAGARLDWRTEQATVEFVANDGARYQVPGQMANYRQEDGRIRLLGQVSDQYEVVQNSDAFSILDAALAGSQAVFTAGGEARNRCFLQVNLPSQGLQVNNRGTLETIERYLLVSTSHDGSSALVIAENPIRVRCWNTLMFASQAGMTYSVRHTTDANQRVQELRSAVSLGYTNLRAAVVVMNQMAEADLSEADFVNYITALYPLISERDDKSKARNMGKVAFEQMADAFLQGKGNSGVSLWDGYNAVTEYVDHRRGVDKTRWVDYTAFGAGAQMKADAFALASAVVADSPNQSNLLYTAATDAVNQLKRARG